MTHQETEADKMALKAVQAHFGKKVVFFRPILQPGPVLGMRGNYEQDDGYWHLRLSGETEAIFVRQNGMGELHVYGPVKHRIIGEN